MKKLYRFSVDYGRMGDIESVFTEDDAVVSKCIGKEVYFGEILGKHSNISVELEESQFEVLSDDPIVIDIIEKYIGETGHNPIGYIDYEVYEDDGEDEDESDDEDCD